jgi:hypothetical protein
VEGAFDVRVDVELRLLDGRANTGTGGQMDDGVKTAHIERFSHEQRIGDVTFAKLHLGAERSQVFTFDGRVVVVVDVVDDGDLARFVAKQPFDGMGADEAGAASDKNVHERRMGRRGFRPPKASINDQRTDNCKT